MNERVKIIANFTKEKSNQAICKNKIKYEKAAADYSTEKSNENQNCCSFRECE